MERMGSVVNEIPGMTRISSVRVEDSGSKMEGWLYLIRSNRFGLQYSRRRYYILKHNILRSFKNIPMDDDEEPIRSAVIDACIRVTDDGRENIKRKMFFIFTIYNATDHNDRLKLGASSSEEAAQWIRSLQDAATKESLNPSLNFMSCSRRRWPSLRLCTPSKKPIRKHSIDWTSCSSIHTEAMTSDVIAPSPWIIFGCQNGLRLFKEAKDWNSGQRRWDNHPAIMAVGVVDGTSEAIFRTLMSLGSSRAEWDFCFYRGSVVEHIDGHTDIIHKQLYNDWLPWGMQRRDLLLRRYWRREDDGTYVILYHSVFNKKWCPQRGYVRACLKSGGYVVTPINQGKQSLVKHMLSVDWKFWKLYLQPSLARAITIRMLERVAALREMFKYKAGFPTEYSSDELMKDIGLPLSEKEEIIKSEVVNPEKAKKVDGVKITENEPEKLSTQPASLMGFNDAADEFFDVSEPMDHDLQETMWSPEFSPEFHSQTTHQSKLPCAANFVKKLHDLAVQKKGYVDLQELAKEDSSSCSYGTTLPNDPNHIFPCTWTTADPSTFLIRGATYLLDNEKVNAQGTLMQMVGADWLRSDKREDDLAGRPESIVQIAAERGGPEFFFIVNIQVPGTTTYNLGLYYMMQSPLEENPILQRFVNGDDAYRNSRFKLIPYISKGSWIVKQSVGKKACLVGQALEINYFRGKNYLELDIDVGSSTVARGVVSLVLGYLNNLVIEMAFLIQGNTQEELPEFLLGTCQLNQLDASKAVCVNP